MDVYNLFIDFLNNEISAKEFKDKINYDLALSYIKDYLESIKNDYQIIDDITNNSYKGGTLFLRFAQKHDYQEICELIAFMTLVSLYYEEIIEKNETSLSEKTIRSINFLIEWCNLNRSFDTLVFYNIYPTNKELTAMIATMYTFTLVKLEIFEIISHGNAYCIEVKDKENKKELLYMYILNNSFTENTEVYQAIRKLLLEYISKKNETMYKRILLKVTLGNTIED